MQGGEDGSQRSHVGRHVGHNVRMYFGIARRAARVSATALKKCRARPAAAARPGSGPPGKFITSLVYTTAGCVNTATAQPRLGTAQATTPYT